MLEYFILSVFPNILLAQILNWTGGQPFLTQKLCYLLVKQHQFIRADVEREAIDKLVTTELITDWESKDNPPHFKTIATRLTADEMRSGSLLGLYQQILNYTNITLDDRSEERELQLSGIAVKFGDRLKVANPIYAAIFDRLWVDKQLAILRPYSAVIKEWLESNKQDKSRLLTGKALEDALTWAKGKNLSNLDSLFLNACREQRIYAANQEVLQQRIKQLWLLSGIATICALCALYLGSESHREKEKAQIATIGAKNALNQALIKSDNSKNTLETLIGTLEATQLFQEQQQSLNQIDRQKLQQETSTNLQYALYGTLEKNRLRHDNTVTGTNYSPNGKFIASVSKDKTLKIWQVDGKLITSVIHPHVLLNLAISSDSQQIVTVGDDAEIRVWNDRGVQLFPRLEQRNHNDKFSRVTITPDTRYVAAATNNDSQDAEIIIWERQSGLIIKNLKFPRYPVTTGSDKSDPLENRTHSFRDLKFSADGKFLAAASTDTTIKVWQWQLDRRPQILTGHQDWAYSLSFSNDGKWLASSGGGSDKSLETWEIKADIFNLKKTIENIHDDGFYVTFDPNTRQLATAASTLRIWDFDRIVAHPNSTIVPTDWGNILLTTIGSIQSEYKSINYSPDGNRIAVAATDYQLVIWEPDRSLKRNISASKLSIKKVIYSHNGKYIATAGSDKMIRIWRSNGTLLQTIKGHKDWIFGLSFSSDDRSIASASEDNTVKIWRVSDGKLLHTLKHDNFAYDVSFSPDNRYLASVGEDGKLKIWYAKNGKFLKEFKITNNDHWLWKVTFSPDSRYLATNTTAGVELFRTSDFVKVRTLDDNGRKMKTLMQTSFSNDSQTIAATGIDGIVRLWNVNDGKSLAKYKAHRDAIHDIQFNASSQEMATTGNDGTIKFWNRNGELHRTIEGFNGLSVAFSPDGSTFVAADKNGVMKFWNLAKLERKYLSLDAAYAKGCRQLQEYLAHRQSTHPNSEESSIESICR